jgi:hypothetical protein
LNKACGVRTGWARDSRRFLEGAKIDPSAMEIRRIYMDKQREQNVNEEWQILDWVNDVVRESFAVSDLIERLVSTTNDLKSYQSQGSVPFNIVFETAAIVMMLQQAKGIFNKDFGELLMRMCDVVEKDPKKVAELKALTRR